MSGKIDKVNANGITYAVEPVVSRKIQQGDHLPASSGAVYDALYEALVTAQNMQPMQLETPVTVAGTVYYTVETALKAIAENFTDQIISGSTKFLTAGGAYADKSDDPRVSSRKNFTAGGAYVWFGKCSTPASWLAAALGNHS